MRILFWGTPAFALPALRVLTGEGFDVVGVVTQPDRPAGRGRKVRPSPVRVQAEEEGIPVLTPERPRGPEFMAQMEALAPDLSVVVAYGHILRPEVLELPTRGSINIHASLLPELRGAAPIHWAIVRGHTETGITIMRMTAGMDEGPILLQRPLPIGADDTVSGLTLRLSELGADALHETVALLDELEPREQDHARATYAPRIDRETARIDWTKPARDIANHVRGMDAVPGAWTDFDGDPVKLFSPRILEGLEEAPLVMTAGDGGRVAFDEVQPAGKRRMSAEAWARGR